MADELHFYVAGSSPGQAPLDWAAGQTFSLPASLHRLLAEEAPPEYIARKAAAAAEALRERAMYTDKIPVSGRLPFSYRVVPGPLRRLIASSIGRVQRRRQHSWARYPGWPLDLSCDFAADLAGTPNSVPRGATPVVLSHDLDSPEGLRNLHGSFLALEEAAGARSVSFVVPCAWPLEHALLEQVVARGHEIGIHGYDHSNRTPFLDADQRLYRLRAALPLIERYHVLGYRAPSLLRTRRLLQDLAGIYRYDSSIPTSGGPFPVPNNGCATARPFRLVGLWEIPVSMPRDGTLRFLGHDAEDILQVWKECAEQIARSGGVVNLLTHCERSFSGSGPMLAIYRRFLEHLAEDERFSFVTASGLLSCLEPSA